MDNSLYIGYSYGKPFKTLANPKKNYLRLSVPLPRSNYCFALIKYPSRAPNSLPAIASYTIS